MQLVLARHGESEANLARVFSNRELAHPLTGAGREQAASLAAKLIEFGPSALYCSPVLRARHTATIAGALLGIEPLVTEALREFDVGRWEGTSKAEGWTEYAEVARAWAAGESGRRVGGGESLDEVVGRFRPWVFGLEAVHGPEAAVAAVGHGGVYRAALPSVASNVPAAMAFEHPLGYGDLVICEVAAGHLRCMRWGGIAM